MKRVLLFMIFIVTFASMAFAQNIHNAASTLPKNVQTFIQTHFKEAKVMHTEYDDDDFEVLLSNGIKIEFLMNGEWKEVKAYGTSLPDSILPMPVANTLKKQFPKNTIYKVEKEWNGYEINLNDMRKIFIDGNGTFLGQKYDD